MYVCVCVCVCVRVCTRARVCVFERARPHTHTCVCVFESAHTHTHTHACLSYVQHVKSGISLPPPPPTPHPSHSICTSMCTMHSSIATPLHVCCNSTCTLSNALAPVRGGRLTCWPLRQRSVSAFPLGSTAALTPRLPSTGGACRRRRPPVRSSGCISAAPACGRFPGIAVRLVHGGVLSCPRGAPPHRPFGLLVRIVVCSRATQRQRHMGAPAS